MADDGQDGAPGAFPGDATDPDGPTWRLPPPPPPTFWGAPPQHQPPPRYGGYGPAPQWGPPPPQYGGYAPPPQWAAPPPQYGGYAPPPQFGPPPFGGYASPPGAPQAGSRRRLVVLLAVAAVVVVAGVVAIVLAARGGGTRGLSTSAVERDVAAQFQAEQGVAVTLTCDSRMPLVTGATYSCRGTTAQGEQVTLTIRVTDATAATYTWSER